MRWIGCLVLVVTAAPVIAQQTRRSPQLDVTIGAGYGWGGDYTERGAVAEDADGFGPVLRLDAATGVKHIAFVLAAIGGIDVKSRETLQHGSLQLGVRLR